MNKYWSIPFIALALFASILVFYGNSASYNSIDESIDAYFCPKDNCTQVLVDLIMKSDSVECAFYDLELESLIDAIAAKDHKLVLDYDNHIRNEKIKSLNYRLAKRGVQMHNKFCIFDEKTVATGSFNPTSRGERKNNNNLLVIRSEALSSLYTAEFNELYSGNSFSISSFLYSWKDSVTINGTRTEVYFCPEDCSPQIITDLIESASGSVHFMTFSFTSDEIGESLMEAHDRGIDVRGIIEKTQNSRYSEYDKLKDAGIDVALDSNPAFMHHKVFIIDEEIVVAGSANPSNNGFNVNDENLLVVYDKELAKRFVGEFESLRT